MSSVTDTDAAQNIKLPDFHRLVNFPDYLAKNKMSSRQSGCAPQGKRHCVMCGKLRVCSGAGASAPGPNASGEDTLCIIPRQNKGLCTACDVTIWVVVDQAIEIKWCKGCKNFRPWVAFGDKGSATKCVRCRERQREKYATQKEQLRKRRLRQKLNPIEEEKKEEDQVAAAKGLRNLMSAAL
jgi:Zn-finger nucleic acid-binding protein